MDSAHSLPSQRRRRRIIPIIDARFQWKYTMLVTAFGVGLSALMGGLLYKAHRDNTRLLELNPELQQQVMRNDQIFLLYLIIAVILMALGLAAWGLIVTHRISGPLFIVARYLDVLADGQYPDVRPLRKRDELQEFFASFEEAVTTLRNRDTVNLKELDAALSKSDDRAGAVKAMERVRNSLSESLGTAEGVAVE